MFTLSRRLLFLCLVILVAAASWSGSAESSDSNLKVQNKSLIEGQTASIPIVLSDTSNGIAGFYLLVSVSDGSVALIDEVEMPEFGLTKVTKLSSSKAIVEAVDLQRMADGDLADVTLATLKVRAVKRGKTSIDINVLALDDDKGDRIAGAQGSRRADLQVIGLGDCNGDGLVSAADIIGVVMEIFDGDGTESANAPLGMFNGTVGCDATGNLKITADDITCTIFLITSRPCGSSNPIEN